MAGGRRGRRLVLQSRWKSQLQQRGGGRRRRRAILLQQRRLQLSPYRFAAITNRQLGKAPSERQSRRPMTHPAQRAGEVEGAGRGSPAQPAPVVEIYSSPALFLRRLSEAPAGDLFPSFAAAIPRLSEAGQRVPPSGSSRAVQGHSERLLAWQGIRNRQECCAGCQTQALLRLAYKLFSEGSGKIPTLIVGFGRVGSTTRESLPEMAGQSGDPFYLGTHQPPLLPGLEGS